MHPRTQTLLVIIAVVVGLISWEVVVLLNNADGDLISNVLDREGRYLAAIPFFFGMLCTHWFWPVREKLVTTSLLISLILGAALLLTVANWLLQYPDWWGVFSLITGGAIGRLWPNKKYEETRR